MPIEFSAATVRVPAADSAAERQLLEPTSLNLTEARIAVIGANGSGKSTLLRLINGLVRPSSGTVRVNGLDTTKEGPAVRRLVGFMFTDPLSQLVMPTPLEDVELSLRRHHPNRAARRAAAESWLSRFGLLGLAANSVYSLSGGERQLVALTSVLAVEPEILVLDEPTTLLDLSNTHRLRQLLAGLTQHVVFASHDLDFAASADRVLWVENGGIRFDGPAEEGVQRYRAHAISGADPQPEH